MSALGRAPIMLNLPLGVHDRLLTLAASRGTCAAELAPLLLARALFPETTDARDPAPPARLVHVHGELGSRVLRIAPPEPRRAEPLLPAPEDRGEPGGVVAPGGGGAPAERVPARRAEVAQAAGGTVGRVGCPAPASRPKPTALQIRSAKALKINGGYSARRIAREMDVPVELVREALRA